MKKRVVVALSGGVDSSVAAFLLKKKGYDVIGATLLLYDECGKEGAKSCCSIEDILMAKEVASKLKIEHTILDQRDFFKNNVQVNFVKEIARGLTPNPCILCNQLIKFSLLLEYAKTINYEFIATGHYARIVFRGNSVELLRGIDKSKDQSYFLYAVENDNLKKTIFPLGEMTKSDVRKIAAENGLPNYEKKESQDLCFGKGSNLKEIFESFGVKNEKGPIFFKGKKIGEHSGLSNYTVGQRRGISIPYKEPLYVVKIDTKNNSLIVGTKEMAKRKRFRVENWVWKIEDPPKIFDVQVRYRMRPLRAKFTEYEGNFFLEWLNEREIAAPGQSAVGYLGEKVAGGGTISLEEE